MDLRHTVHSENIRKSELVCTYECTQIISVVKEIMDGFLIENVI